jgi:hypothetical protein
MVFLGVVVLAATPQTGVLRTFVEKCGSWAISTFAAVIGSMVGWSLALSVANLVLVGVGRLSLELAGLAVFIGAGSFSVFKQVVPMFNENTGLMFRQRRGEFARVVLGLALMLYGLGLFSMWFLFD